MTMYMETGKKAAEFYSLLSKIERGVVADYWRKKNAEKRGGKTKTESIEFLAEQGIDIPSKDPTESIINLLYAKQMLRILAEAFPKEQAPAQWEIFQAGIAVIQYGVDPLNSREFYSAIYEYCDGRYSREAIRVYWLLVCRTLQRIVEKCFRFVY